MVYSWDLVQPVVLALAATLGMSCLASCGAGVTSFDTFSSSVDLEGMAPVERMFVFADVRSEGFSDAMYEAFETGLTSGLEKCGVRSKTMNLDFRGLEDARKFPAWTEFQPNAVLTIRKAGGRITFSNYEAYVQARQGNRPATLSGTGASSRLNFEFELLDIKSDKVTWRAKTVFSSGDLADSGEGFAISIVSRLKTDGVLKGCSWEGPPPTNLYNPYPGR